MSTTPPPDQPGAPRSTLASVLATWSQSTPSTDATALEVAAWWEHKARLLEPITNDPMHPEHEQATTLAALARQAAQSINAREETGR